MKKIKIKIYDFGNCKIQYEAGQLTYIKKEIKKLCSQKRSNYNGRWETPEVKFSEIERIAFVHKVFAISSHVFQH